MTMTNSQKLIINRLNDENLTLKQLLYLINQQGLENQLDINGGFKVNRAIELLSKRVFADDLDALVEEAILVSNDLFNLNEILLDLKRKQLRSIVKKYTSSHIPSAELINALFLFVPFETLMGELDYESPNKDVLKGIKNKRTGSSQRKHKTKVKIISSGIKEVTLESKLNEYDMDYLLDIFYDHKEYFDSLKDLTREELEEKMNKKELIELFLDKISPQILEEYFNPVVYDFFPMEIYECAREYQIETISQIYNAIEKGYKYIVLEAVSGYGKSLIAATLARIYSEEKSYILTTTNQLLTPYYETFEGYDFYKVIKRSLFNCKTQRNRQCTISSCRADFSFCNHFRDNSCNYLSQFKKGLESDAMICTYDYFFNNAFYRDDELEHRKLLICDEGHNIDDKISSGVSLTFYQNRLEEIGFNIKKQLIILEYTKDYYSFILRVKRFYETFLSSYHQNDHKKRNYSRDLRNIELFLSYFERNDNNLSFEYVKIEYRANELRFAPVKIQKFIPEVVSEYSDVCIFMSSSFFDLENFAYDLGLEESEVYKITVPPIFDFSNNPITIYDDFEMDHESLKNGNDEKAIPIIKEILNKHKNDKGIIHTFSIKCANFLFDNLNESRCMLSYGTDREEELEEFKEIKDNSVLISPSMDEGVDLNDEDCKFQIIFKLPYRSPNIEFVDKRKSMEDGDEWYRYKMLTRLIQAYGRGIRSEKDSCNTYILDRRLWKEILKDYENDTQLIPQYFINAIENYE